MFWVCLSVCVYDNSKTNKQIFLKFFLWLGSTNGRSGEILEISGAYSIYKKLWNLQRSNLLSTFNDIGFLVNIIPKVMSNSS